MSMTAPVDRAERRDARCARWISTVLGLFVSITLAACGGDGSSALVDGGSTPPPGSGSNTIPITPKDPGTLEDTRPAEVYVLALADLGITGSATASEISGGVIAALVKDGTLRIATGDDPGVDEPGTITLTVDGSPVVVSTVVRSARPTEALAHGEANEDGSPSSVTYPQLEIAGLAPGNVLTANALKFRIPGAPRLDTSASDGFMFDSNTGIFEFLFQWDYDETDSSFTIPANAMAFALSSLAPGEISMAVNFVSPDGEFAVAYQLMALLPSATITGRFVAPNGDPVTGLSGRKVLLRGFNTDIRRTATVDDNGAFAFPDVVRDGYQVSLLDLDNPDSVIASVAVFEASTTVEVTLVIGDALAPPSAGTVTKSASSAQRFLGARTQQDGAPPPARPVPGSAGEVASASGPAKKGILAGCGETSPEGAAVFSASAGLMGDTMTCPISYVVPAGTSSVGVRVTITTEEFPDFTTAKSEFNDTWAYALNGLPGTPFSAVGSVNQTHYTQGTITRSACIDVSLQALNSPITLSGQVSATNISDDILPTTTTMSITLGCADDLRVTEAKFTSPFGQNPVISPLKTQGNLRGAYVAVSPTTEIGTWRLPLEIRFQPAKAQIAEVKIGYLATGASEPTFAEVNLLAQPHTIANGKITFPGIVMPAMPGAKVSGRLGFYVKVAGALNEQNVSSRPEEGGQVSFQGRTDFIPLYLANDEPALASRRYGTRDPGGDSWSTSGTIDWLLTRNPAFRFDDTSAAHIAQTATGRSMLAHSGHSDGQQIDLRYTDGQGGFPDPLGGAGNGETIRQMLVAASAEVASNAESKPQLARAIAWIEANRELLADQATRADTRIVYFGDSWMKLALVNGKFPNGNEIPGILGWAKPAKAMSAASHLHHWHISITASP